MTLVNRVSAFFLVALALALASYSLVFYLLVQNYLNRQFNDDLHSALQILSASIEVEPDDAKWHPAEHGIDLNQHILNDVIWVVCDERGQVIDRSPNTDRSDPTYSLVLRYAHTMHSKPKSPIEHAGWRMMQTELSAPDPKPMAEREPHEYAQLRITVARSHAKLDAVLGRLALVVTILPAVVWLIAAIVGRWLVRHALQPVREMADRAGSVSDADFDLRLPVNTTKDELSELANTFNALLDQLQNAFDRQRRFTGDAAHQLRTPLAVLQGQLDVALRRPRTTEDYQKTLGLLSEQTAELRQIVESLLFLARSEGDASIDMSEPVAVDDWLRAYARRWQNHPRRPDLAFDAHAKASVLVPAPLLQQLLDNLLTNAFKYSVPGTPVGVSATSQNGHVEICVSDRGSGIAPDELNEIFEPFYRSPEARRSGVAGTGLGLSVAARIADAVHGRVTCHSTVGQGSVFTVALPAEHGS